MKKNVVGFPARDTREAAEKDAEALTAALAAHLGETQEVRAEKKRGWAFRVEARYRVFQLVFNAGYRGYPYRGGNLGFDLDICARRVLALDAEREAAKARRMEMDKKQLAVESVRERLPPTPGYIVKVTSLQEGKYHVTVNAFGVTEEELFAMVRSLPPRAQPLEPKSWPITNEESTRLGYSAAAPKGEG